MNLTRRGLRRMAVLASLTLLVGVGMLSLPSALQAHSPTPPPLDFDRYLVFMANGVFSPEEMMRDGATFQHGVMGRSPEEVAANKAEAVAFFAERFGVDFSTSDHVQGINLFGFELTPDANYRAYTISGETLPSDGWVVRDGDGPGWSGPRGSPSTAPGAVPRAETFPRARSSSSVSTTSEWNGPGMLRTGTRSSSPIGQASP